MPARFDEKTLTSTLASVVGRWMAATEVDYHTAIYYLMWLAADLKRQGRLHKAWRVRELERAMGLDDDGPEDTA